jgi:hypothetical protein
MKGGKSVDSGSQISIGDGACRSLNSLYHCTTLRCIPIRLRKSECRHHRSSVASVGGLFYATSFAAVKAACNDLRDFVSIPGKWFSSSRLILNSRRRAHRRTAPSGRSDFWILRACQPQLELRILRACLGQSKLWTSWACRACAAAQSCYNKREDRRLFVSAGTARSFARLLRRKRCKAKLSTLLLAFSSP